MLLNEQIYVWNEKTKGQFRACFPKLVISNLCGCTSKRTHTLLKSMLFHPSGLYIVMFFCAVCSQVTGYRNTKMQKTSTPKSFSM